MPETSPLIAIVDDDLLIRQALRRLVQAAGYTAETFASAHEFLAALPSRRSACLILDIHLDGMDGFELRERLVAELVDIPVIFITAHDDAATRERIKESGAAAYLTKPFDRQALLEAIRRVAGEA
ncbi:MAG TPA: response regulator [Methylomirabilota bacterium]|nr:response regulator [Methylomirabilota bacterium]